MKPGVRESMSATVYPHPGNRQAFRPCGTHPRTLHSWSAVTEDAPGLRRPVGQNATAPANRNALEAARKLDRSSSGEADQTAVKAASDTFSTRRCNPPSRPSARCSDRSSIDGDPCPGSCTAARLDPQPKAANSRALFQATRRTLYAVHKPLMAQERSARQTCCAWRQPPLFRKQFWTYGLRGSRGHGSMFHFHLDRRYTGRGGARHQSYIVRKEAACASFGNLFEQWGQRTRVLGGNRETVRATQGQHPDRAGGERHASRSGSRTSRAAGRRGPKSAPDSARAPTTRRGARTGEGRADLDPRRRRPPADLPGGYARGRASARRSPKRRTTPRRRKTPRRRSSRRCPGSRARIRGRTRPSASAERRPVATRQAARTSSAGEPRSLPRGARWRSGG